MSCDDYCCNHGCNQGRDCPARKTPAKEVPDDTEELDSDIGDIVLDGTAIALIVWLVAFVFAPALAGYLSHMRGCDPSEPAPTTTARQTAGFFKDKSN